MGDLENVQQFWSFLRVWHSAKNIISNETIALFCHSDTFENPFVQKWTEKNQKIDWISSKWNWTLKRQFLVEKVKWSWKRKCVYGLDEWVGHLGNFRRRTLCTYLPFLACLLGGIYLSFSLFSCVHILIYRLIWDSRARAHDASSSLLLLLLHLVAHFQMTFQSLRVFLSLSFSISICKGVRPSSIGVHINDGMRCCFASKVLVDEPWVQKCCVSTTLICFIF